VAKTVSATVEPMTLTFLRGIISAAAFILIVLVRNRKQVDRSDYPRMFWLAFIAIPINQFLFLYGIKFTTAANAALLYATTPALVSLISRYFLHERLSRLTVIGIAIAFCGAALVIFERGIDLSSGNTYGNLMIFIAVISWAIYTVAGKPMVIKYGAFYTSAVSMIGGTLLFIPLGLYGLSTFPTASLTAGDWGGLLYLGLGTSVVSYAIWFYAIGKMGTSKVAIFSNAQPVVTTLLSFFLLHQAIGNSFVAGGCLTIVGVVLAQRG
jgi:drug/metabolite transporter (DMT)-like permease